MGPVELKVTKFSKNLVQTKNRMIQRTKAIKNENKVLVPLKDAELYERKARVRFI